MGRFCPDFGASLSKIVNWFNHKEEEQVGFQSFARDEEVDGEMLCSNVDLRVDSQQICTCIISAHSDWNMKPKVGKAFPKPSNMAGTVGHGNEFCFSSWFGDRGLFLSEPGDTTVIEENNVTGGESSGIVTASKVSVNINMDRFRCCVRVK